MPGVSRGGINVPFENRRLPSPDKTYPGEAREARRNSCFHHRQALIFKHAIKIIKMSSYALLTLSLSPSA